jgi:uncharacterized protein YhaN
MSQTQQQLTGTNLTEESSESTQTIESEVGDTLKLDDSSHLVPVSEAIRYRKRAQAAEQQVEQLTERLREREREQEEIKTRLDEALLETELTHHLAEAGAIDVEAALLLVQRKLKASNGKEKDSKRLIEILRNDKPYLFSNAVSEVCATLAGPTAGVRSHSSGRANILSRAAQQARNSGNRQDMQEYLRLRRSTRG